MKNKILFCTLSLFAALISFSQIIHVPGDQPTIQAGINAANDGDTVLVAQGTYYENINFFGKAITVASNFIMDSDTIVAPDALVAHWLFNGDGSDASGNGHDGTISAGHPNWGGGMPELAEDRHGNADYCYKFVDGGNFVVPNSPAFIPGELTISVWMKLYETWAHNYFISNDIWYTWKFQVQNDNKLFFTVHILKDDGSGEEAWIDRDSNTGILALDTWHHVVVTYTSGNMRFYFDGQLTQHWDDFPTGTIIPPHEGIDLCIGQALATDDFDDDLHEWQEWLGYFKGYLDDMRFYNVVLTDAQVTTLYDYEKDNTITYPDSSHIFNTIIDGGQPANPDSASVVYFYSGEDTTSILCGFTIQNGTGTYPDGWGDRSGGGIFCEHSSAKIIHNRIINNQITNTISGAFGGGVYADEVANSGNTLIMEYNIISNNSVYTYAYPNVAYGAGGWISIYSRSHNNIIKNNYAEGYAYGGGIVFYMCSGDFSHNLIENNHINVTTAQNGWGGGVFIYNPSSGLKIAQNTILNNNCTGGSNKAGGIGVVDYEELGEYFIDGNIIKDNMANSGGGVSLLGSKFAHITNNIIQDNECNSAGGGIYLYNASKDDMEIDLGRGRLNSTYNQKINKENSMQQIVNNTITQNTSGNYGGGIANKLNGYDLVVLNNIIYDNSATHGDEMYLYYNTSTAHLYNNDIDTNLIVGNGIWTGDNNIFVDPEFDDDGYHLLPSSQCIEAGILSIEIDEEMYYCPDHDIDGQMRPLNATADIGADEVLITGMTESLTADNNLSLYNSPNPFNGTTTISFVLESDCFTELSIYDLTGKKIRTLISENKQAGNHKTEMDAGWLDNGVYFCVLKTNEGMQTKKMIKL